MAGRGQQKPTPRLVFFLENRGIAPPSNIGLCCKYVEYIKHGNGTERGPTAEEQRIAQLKDVRNRYKGKRAVVRNGCEVDILEIYPRSRQEILMRIRGGQEDAREIGPFLATYAYLSDGRRRTTNCSLDNFVTMLEEEEKP